MSRRKVEFFKSVLIFALVMSILFMMFDKVVFDKKSVLKDDYVAKDNSSFVTAESFEYGFAKDFVYKDFKILIGREKELQDVVFDMLKNEDALLQKVENYQKDKFVKINLFDAFTLNEYFDIYASKHDKLENVDKILNDITVVLEPKPTIILNMEGKNFEVNAPANLTAEIFELASSILAQRKYDVDVKAFQYKSLDNVCNFNDMKSGGTEKLFIPYVVTERFPVYIVKNKYINPEYRLTNSLVAKVFGASKSFVKKLKSTTGDIIFMYGYGRKTLKISRDGVVSYTIVDDKKANTLQDKNSFIKSLVVALDFVQNFDKSYRNIKLVGMKKIRKDKFMEYRFSFISPVSSYYEIKGKSGIEVLVRGEEVVACEIDSPDFFDKKYVVSDELNTGLITKEPKVKQMLDSFEFRRRLVDEYKKINNISHNVISYDLEREAMQSLDDFYIKYYHKKNEFALYPAFVFCFGNVQFVFDYYSNKLVEVIK